MGDALSRDKELTLKIENQIEKMRRYKVTKFLYKNHQIYSRKNVLVFVQKPPDLLKKRFLHTGLQPRGFVTHARGETPGQRSYYQRYPRLGL